MGREDALRCDLSDDCECGYLIVVLCPYLFVPLSGKNMARDQNLGLFVVDCEASLCISFACAFLICRRRFSGQSPIDQFLNPLSSVAVLGQRNTGLTKERRSYSRQKE